MTTDPKQPAQSPQPALDAVGSALADQLAAAERELAQRLFETAPYLAGLRAAEENARALRHQRRAARRRTRQDRAMRCARLAVRWALALYGVIALINALLLVVHGKPNTEMFIAAAGAIGAAAVIPTK